MMLDEQLINKSYYEMYINELEGIQPIRVLGDLFQEEQKKDAADLSYLRYAQGEVYFHIHDFETAIFKWEKVINELEPWAKKNMADAYYELGMLPTAEKIYESISTENATLSAENALHLFSLYVERGKTDSAVTIIKKTVAENPDYPHVTEFARAFFEGQKDWANAIELAFNEAVRTEELQWFDILKIYIDKGFTIGLEPNYFSGALPALYKLDQARFEEMVSAIWKSYKEERAYFSWLREINHLLIGLDAEVRTGSWHELSKDFKETYFSLIDGRYLISRLEELVPTLLINWLRITDKAQALLAATAVLSWSELFPSSIPSTYISDAENLFSNTPKNVNEFNECLHLFDLILEWAEVHDMGANLRLKWMAAQLTNFELHNIYLAGVNGSGNSAFINLVMGGEIMGSAPASTVVLFKDDAELNIEEINDSESFALSTISDFRERMERRRNSLESILEFKQPAPFLQENNIAIFDTPGLNGNHYDCGEILKYLSVSDTVLFILEKETPFTEKEREILSYIQNEAPETPIHFIINKLDISGDEEASGGTINEMRAEIRSYLPEAKVLAIPSHYTREQQLKELSDFIRSIKPAKNIEDLRLAKLLSFIRATITMLLKKRISVENQLIESVRWNEDIVMKLNGALNQLSDLEGQSIKVVTRSYRAFKESMQKEMLESIPKLLRECSQYIKEDSNFSSIHLDLNEMMNRSLQDYLDHTVLPKYVHSLQEWIDKSKDEFGQGQAFLKDMAEGFNALYGEERMQLECDLKILDDWRRDKDRMTSSFKLENINILLRRTPAQLLLKSAGKLFGALSQNKAVLYNKYKAFVETEDYTEPAAIVSKQFFRQFELFEKSLERDIALLFRNPANVMNQFVEESRAEIRKNEKMLKKMNTNPELFRDPLTLFEVRLRQYEWMTVSRKIVHTNHR